MLINVNSKKYEVELDKKLIRFLRDDLRLTSVKDGCSQGACGSCTIVIDGRPTKSCNILLSEVVGKNILTIEGLSEREREVYSYAFSICGAVQCGFCIPGMILCTKTLLDTNNKPTEKEIRHALRNNICRCTGYKKIIDAVLLSARIFRGEEEILKQDEKWKIGDSVIKIDAQKKALGEAKYADDIYIDGMLYVVAHRTKYPRAKVVSIDTTLSRSVNGVVGIYTAKDVPGSLFVGHIKRDWQAFIPEEGITRYLGDVIAIVVADSYYNAIKASDLIKVKYEVLEPITSPQQASSEDCPEIHDGGNLLGYVKVEFGNVDEALKNADYVLTEHFSTPMTEHAFLEPECAVAQPLDNGGIRIYCSDQGVYDTRHEVAPFLNIESDKIEVENCCIGGGFGGKEDVSVQHYVSLAALKTNKPCKMKLSRSESMTFHPKRHPMEMDFTIGCDKKGKILGLKAKVISDTGAYASLGIPVLHRACTHASGPYHFSNFKIDGYAYYTNNPPCGAFRGFGVTQTCFGIESILNHIADIIGISHYDIRYINAIRPNQSLPNGQIVDNATGLVETLEAVKKDFESSNVAGIACAMKNTGVGVGLEDYGRVRLDIEDGKVVIHTASSDLGQGVYTVVKQIVCDVTSLDSSLVFVKHSNTHDSPDSGTSSGSRHTAITGEAARLSAEKLKKDLDEYRNKNFDDLSILNNLNKKKYYSEYLAKTDSLDSGLKNPKSHIAYSYATQVAILDEKTHKIDRIIAAHDIGKAINKTNIEGQIEGGVIMGVGYSLREEFQLNRCIPETKFGSLGIFRADEVPDIQVKIIEKEGLGIAFGAKGIGEIVCIPTAPAIADAYYRLDKNKRLSLPLKNTPYEKEQLSQIYKTNRRTLMVGKAPRCINCLECMLTCSKTYFNIEKSENAFLQVREKKGKGFASGIEGEIFRPVVCIQCGKCAQVCPVGAIKKNTFGTYIIDLKMCINCGKCRQECPFSLIVEDKVNKVSKKCIACGKCTKACPTGLLKISVG